MTTVVSLTATHEVVIGDRPENLDGFDKVEAIEKLERSIRYLKSDCDRQALAVLAEVVSQLGWSLT